ncbi:GyrI-like domain-containing protein [Flavobacterium azooxidireducens]|uniref:GyrI-like domain-containing protein n=1 Tax=Flavobacterium azooxidireducens TaxID=1871076 RepID=A0ABY4KE78_9FLAO|nr:GyrI-like domain-containing protein [Flavobacterium azooxidireducens]UPQ79104.1 GyrI-like domain-containing protein [Flavobacterium azooxidireducens]
MRILKYILLLILLILLAFSVYLSTKEGNFSVTKSKVINIEKSTLFQYVNDYQNWESFLNLNEKNLKASYPNNTVGVGGSFNWTGSNGNGSVETTFLKENDSIAQKVSWNGVTSDAFITFKDTVGGTKVTWNSSGKLDFMGKVESFFSSGFEKKLGSDFENNLIALEKVLSKEISTYSIDLDGIVEVSHQKYLKRKGESTISGFYTALQESMPLLYNFVQENKIKTNKQKFVVFDKYDVANDKVEFSIASTLMEIIYTTPESEFTVDSIMPHQALKITLKGDYSHSKEAWDKGFDYLKKNNLEQNYNGTFREVYVKNNTEVKQPSQWLTEIYIPVKQQISKPIRPVPVTPTPIE